MVGQVSISPTYELLFDTEVRWAAFIHLYAHFWCINIGVKCWWNWPQIIQASLICNRFFIISSRFNTFFSIEITLTDFGIPFRFYPTIIINRKWCRNSSWYLSLLLTKIIQNWNWKENDKLLSKRSHFLNKKPRNLYSWRHENTAIKN